MFTLISGLVCLIFVVVAVIFLLVVGLLIKLAALKLFVAVVLKATLHGIFPHLGAVLLVMITTLLIGATLTGLAVCSWWP